MASSEWPYSAPDPSGSALRSMRCGLWCSLPVVIASFPGTLLSAWPAQCSARTSPIQRGRRCTFAIVSPAWSPHDGTIDDFASPKSRSLNRQIAEHTEPMTHMSDERPESLKSYLGADPGDADRSRCSIACEDSMNWMYIVCHSYYDAMRSCRLIGGVETYVNSLISLAKQRGYSAVILQQGPEHPDIRLEDGTTIKYWQSLDEVATELRDLQEVAPGIIIYSDFPCTPARVEHPSVIIQHGVGWDYRGPTRQNPIVEQLYKTTLPVRHYLLHHRIRRLAQAVDRVICVDTNFVNFLRTRFVSDDWDGRLVYEIGRAHV